VGVAEFMPALATTCIGRYYRTTVPRNRINNEVVWILEGNKNVVAKKVRDGEF